MATAFQPNAFQHSGFQIEASEITDTDILQKPVDVVLAGQQRITDRYREFDLRAPNRRQRVTVSTRGMRRLNGGTPSFTVKTGKRGYD